ncbi:MAG: winged helix-turn-helix domain-containing protein [Planctomycetota bacterium]|nr:winged helix-turn-helix domain-containing protein [Planctomycetota bacterium]
MKPRPVPPSKAPEKRPRPVAPDSASRSKPRSQAVVPTVPSPKEAAASTWTFLTNHSHVLVLLSRSPSLVLREVALRVGITERAVQRIIADLEAGGVIEREKIGRQNHYQILVNQPLRHPLESHRTIGDILDLFRDTPETA